MQRNRVVIIGAGLGGLAAALKLACGGAEVTVIERAAAPGGKLREIEVAGRRLDAGPTVLTMRWIFDELFEDAGTSLEQHLVLQPIEILARHFWNSDSRLDLFGDVARTADAIGAFAGPQDARGYLAFSEHARQMFETLDQSFMRSASHGLLNLIREVGIRRPAALLGIAPFAKLNEELRRHFRDPKLRQLFGRYATYCGSSPYQCPATLMLISHVERMGVWSVKGGIRRIAEALTGLAEARGVSFRYNAHVDRIVVKGSRARGVRCADGEHVEADAVLLNGDIAALADGRFGVDAARAVGPVSRADRSLSAVTWAMVANTNSFPLQRHTVFFSGDDAAEFKDLFGQSRVPAEPTVYVCAQDRDGLGGVDDRGPERLFCIVNAPATGDLCSMSAKEFQRCETAMLRSLSRCGLTLATPPGMQQVTTPAEFEQLFPATGGALYGTASHGWQAAFKRSGARSRIPGLYLAGGSVHPGPGMPMAVLSGRIAASRMLSDLASTPQSTRMATLGGTSTR